MLGYTELLGHGAEHSQGTLPVARRSSACIAEATRGKANAGPPTEHLTVSSFTTIAAEVRRREQVCNLENYRVPDNIFEHSHARMGTRTQTQTIRTSYSTHPVRE